MRIINKINLIRMFLVFSLLFGVHFSFADDESTSRRDMLYRLYGPNQSAKYVGFMLYNSALTSNVSIPWFLEQLHPALRNLPISYVDNCPVYEIPPIPSGVLASLMGSTFPEEAHSGFALLQSEVWRDLVDAQLHGIRFGIAADVKTCGHLGKYFHQGGIIVLPFGASPEVFYASLRLNVQYNALGERGGSSGQVIGNDCLVTMFNYISALDRYEKEFDNWLSYLGQLDINKVIDRKSLQTPAMVDLSMAQLMDFLGPRALNTGIEYCPREIRYVVDQIESYHAYVSDSSIKDSPSYLVKKLKSTLDLLFKNVMSDGEIVTVCKAEVMNQEYSDEATCNSHRKMMRKLDGQFDLEWAVELLGELRKTLVPYSIGTVRTILPKETDTKTIEFFESKTKRNSPMGLVRTYLLYLQKDSFKDGFEELCDKIAGFEFLAACPPPKMPGHWIPVIGRLAFPFSYWQY